MASVTIDISPQMYAESSTLGAYAASGWLPGQIPVGAPKGSAVDTDTITGGKVTFDLPVGSYFVTKTTTPYSYVSVIVTAPKSNGGGGGADFDLSMQEYGSRILPLDPITVLSLGSTDGLVDESGNGNHGSAAGGVDVGAYAPGPLALADVGATDFDNTDDGVVVTGITYNPALSQTWMGWCRRQTDDTFDVLVASPETQSPALVVTSSGDTEFRRHGSTDTNAAVWSGVAPETNKWVHWALTINQDTAKVELFLNGVSQGVKDRGAAPSSPGAIQFGLRQTSGIPWHGQMAWVSVHSRVLSTSEIRSVFEQEELWRSLVSKEGPWKPLTLAEDCADPSTLAPGTFPPLRYRRNGDTLRFSGMIMVTANPDPAKVLAVLDEEDWPLYPVGVGVAAADSNNNYLTTALTIEANGELYCSDEMQLLPLSHITVELT